MSEAGDGNRKIAGLRVTRCVTVAGRTAGVLNWATAQDRRVLDWAAMAAPVVPLALAAVLSGAPGAWLCLLLVSALPRLGMLMCQPALPVQIRQSVCAASSGAMLTFAILLGGNVGLFASAAAVLLTLRAARPGGQSCGVSATAIAAIFALVTAGTAASGGGAQVIESSLLNCFGSLAVLLEAGVLLAGKQLENDSKSEVLDPHALAVLNHELRTPLNAIIGFAGLMSTLQLDHRLTERQTDYARIIETSGQHILAVLEATVGGSSERQEQPIGISKPVELETLIAESLELLAPMANAKAINLRLTACTSHVQDSGQARAIRQILINIMANAIKFSPAGSDVAVSASQHRGGQIEIQVADCGMGIDAADLLKIGKPFRRGAKAKMIEGTGLGLAICGQLAEQLGASLRIESRAGSGTTATLVLESNAAPKLQPPSRYLARSGTPVNAMLAIGA